MFADVIREARNEHEVYFLLTSYVEAVRFGDPFNLVPEPVKHLPLTNKDQVRAQYQQLADELDKASKITNESACVVIREALPVFSAAVDRLAALGPGEPVRRKRESREHGSGAESHHRIQPGV